MHLTKDLPVTGSDAQLLTMGHDTRLTIIFLDALASLINS